MRTLQGGGEAGHLLRQIDWVSTSLGAPYTWPQSLRTSLGIVLESHFAMCVAWGPDLLMLYNDAWASILGKRHPVALVAPAREVYQTIWSKVGPFLEEAWRGKGVGLEDFPLSGGSRYFTFSASPIRCTGGQVQGLLVTLIETTERVTAARVAGATLDLQRSRLNELFMKAPAMINIQEGPDHVFTLVHPLTRRTLGGRDILGLPVREAIPELEGQAMLEILDEVYRTGEPYYGHEVAARLDRHNDGELEDAYFNFVYQPLRGPEGGVIGVMTFALEVTDQVYSRRQMEELAALEREARTRAEAADRRKDEFLAMLAHELRNPLAPMMNATQLLRLAGAPPERVARARDVLDRQVRHMARLVDDLLEVSRISRGKIHLQRERLDLAALVREVAADRADGVRSAGLDLACEMPSTPVWVHGDRTRLAQVITNLLGNAVKFTESGGRIRVRVEIRPRFGEAEVRVTDTGIGIDPSLLPTLFDAFTQADHTLDRSRGGLGLGLAVVKGLVDLHGGSVIARSEGPGHGSEFHIRLPLDRSPGMVEERGAAMVSDPPGRRVLVIEDNIDAAETLKELLEANGHTVHLEYSGRRAVAVADEFRPDIVLCDLGLPEKDGFTVASELRQDARTASLRLVALSGYGSDEDRRRSRRAGFDEHLIKPVDMLQLSRVIDGGTAVVARADGR